ncbi:MAG TPA: MFS transporter, partial [Acidimicrobiales bacterium]|nr:MFS transporter [Acidimicrobiales bacterium]
RVAHPLIDLRVLGTRTVTVANAATVGLGWGMFTTFLLIPAMVQGNGPHGFGADPTVSGWFLLPAAIGELLAGPVANPLTRRSSGRTVFATGLGLASAALVALATVHHAPAQVLAGTFVLGLGAGLAIQSASVVVTQGVPADKVGMSTTVNTTVRRFAGGIGSQVSAVILATLVLGPGGEPARSGFVVSFAVAAALAAVGAGLALRMVPTRG